MIAKQYIHNKLKELHRLFPELTIKYEYDSYTQMHIVDIMPLSEYENNEEYKKYESKIGFEFDNQFFPESIMFVSSDSLTQVVNSELTIEPLIRTNITNVQIDNEFFEVEFNITQSCGNTINDSKNYSLAA